MSPTVAHPVVGGMTSVGLELIQAQAILQIHERLPAELERQAQAWDYYDGEVARQLGIPSYKTILERPPDGSYFPGARLGVLSMPWDAFPMVATMCDTAVPTAESSRLDHGMVYSVSLWIEAVVRSDEYEVLSGVDDPYGRVFEEGVVDRRAKRMLEAVVQCIDADRSLGGATPGLEDPRMTQTDPFTISSSEAGEQGKKRVFALVRAEYPVSTYPSHRDSSIPAPDPLLRGFGSPLTP